MPGITTHIAFSCLFLPQLEEVDPYDFLLGTIAPDTFDRSASGSFQLHHFAGPDGVSDLERLRSATGGPRQYREQDQTSFVDGYFAHLWFDNHARLYEDVLKIENPTGLEGNDLRKAVRACIEGHDLAIIGDFLKGLEPHPQSLTAIPGLEFISIKRTERLLQQVIDRQQDVALPTAGMIDGEKYREFLAAAAKEFLSFIRHS